MKQAKPRVIITKDGYNNKQIEEMVRIYQQMFEKTIIVAIIFIVWVFWMLVWTWFDAAAIILLFLLFGFYVVK